jgi:hypothetical protein
MSPLYRSTANIARKHSRISVIAAAAATAAALGAAGFAAGAVPWEQSAGNVATTAHVDSSSTSGQPGSSPLFKAIAGIKTAHAGTPAASGQLDVFRSAGPAGSTSANATGGQAIVTFAAEEANVQAAAQAKAVAAAKAKAAVQAKTVAAAKLKAAAQAKAAARAKAFAQAKASAAVKAKATVAAAKARAAASAKPYIIYDSVTPSSIPSGKAAAVYANGAYAASSAQTAGHGSVLWIDTNGSDPAANVLDVEPGDATPAGAAQWVQQRLTHQPKSVAIVYTMRSDWQQVKDNVAALPGWMQSKVRYWIADPTGTPHVVPGSSATQWYWGNSYDVTTANPNFVR